MTDTCDASAVLRNAKAILVVDWPSKDVPETLARAGYSVTVKGGPEPDNYTAYKVETGDVLQRPLDRRADHVDLVYCYRPIEELAGLARAAHDLGARALWLQSGQTANGERDPKGCWLSEQRAREARRIVRSFGLEFIVDAYIADAVRGLISRS